MNRLFERFRNQMVSLCSSSSAANRKSFSEMLENRFPEVHYDTNPRYWTLLKAFQEKTGYGLLVNTSFNVRGEPIVCTPDDAYRCFMGTEMDCLVMGDFIFDKESQPRQGDSCWGVEVDPD